MVDCGILRRLSAPGYAPSSWRSLDGVALTALIGLRQNHSRAPEPLSVAAKQAGLAPRHEALKHFRVRQRHAITSVDSFSHFIALSVETNTRRHSFTNGTHVAE